MSSQNPTCVELRLAADPSLARLVRMSAANVAMLSSMSVERVEDIKMAAEEAFIFACSASEGAALAVAFKADETGVSMDFLLFDATFDVEQNGDANAVYADLILASVCDAYEKSEDASLLHIELGADV